MTNPTQYQALKAQLFAELMAKFPESAALQTRAENHLIDGGHHGLRLMKPFPPRPKAARGAWLTEENGTQILDFWQGHYTNLLGHNPPVVTNSLTEMFANGYGLQTGHEDRLGIEVAEILAKQCQAEAVRLTTSGAIATMNAIMLARAFTGRNLVLKVGGGWHGGHPWGLKGYTWQGGFDKVDSAGIPKKLTDEIVLTQFNNLEMLEKTFLKYGEKLACFILEPMIGSGGMMPARRDFMEKARELTEKYGVLLISDEVIAGFRFRAGNCAALYNIQPDLTTMGKAIGGGMPVAAVVGRRDVLDLVSKKRGAQGVKFSGGTYSAHPSSMLAAKVFLEYLVKNEATIYPKIANSSEKLRLALQNAFIKTGVEVRFSGDRTGFMPDCSLLLPIFNPKKGQDFDTPEAVADPKLNDVELRENIFQLAMLVENCYVIHGLGCATLAHEQPEIDYFSAAAQRVAERLFG
jgi:glutamate-1-semialdehyde 2,1-aminomutase